MPNIAIKPTGHKKDKIDGRTKNGNKIDIAKVIKLKDVNKLSFQEIADSIGYTKQYVHRVYNHFKSLLPEPEVLDTFKHNRANLLSGIEYNLLQDLGDTTKREKASLNNTAYAFNTIHAARRLEEGKSIAGGTTVTIELAFQQAETAAREARRIHVQSNVKQLEHDDTIEAEVTDQE